MLCAALSNLLPVRDHSLAGTLRPTYPQDFFDLSGCLIHIMISWMTCSRAAEAATSDKFGRSGES